MDEISRLAKILNKLLKDNENDKNKVLTIHFFAVRYADNLMGFNNDSLKSILKEAGVKESYVIEINKMLKLSNYTSTKQKL